MIKSKLFFIILAFLLIAFYFGKMNYENSLKNGNSDSSEKIVFEIEEGSTVDSILQGLIDNGLMQKNYFYYAKLYLKINDLGSKLQAGSYELPKNLNIEELIASLQSGKDRDVWVTIPEGLRKDEIAKILQEELGDSTFSSTEFLSLCEDTEFINNLELDTEVTDLEGFLFPDKYALPLDSTAESVIQVMIDNFKNRIGKEYTYEDIILASIVEREGNNSEDRPIIAGIIIKRLEEGWLLQTDATLLYPVKDWKHIINDEDKSSDSPYNTYKKIGLPPTPICNPGLESIQAVQNPQKSDYYYYIHDNDGVAHYGRNLSEHNSNVSEYLR